MLTSKYNTNTQCIKNVNVKYILLLHLISPLSGEYCNLFSILRYPKILHNAIIYPVPVLYCWRAYQIRFAILQILTFNNLRYQELKDFTLFDSMWERQHDIKDVLCSSRRVEILCIVYVDRRRANKFSQNTHIYSITKRSLHFDGFMNCIGYLFGLGNIYIRYRQTVWSLRWCATAQPNFHSLCYILLLVWMFTWN